MRGFLPGYRQRLLMFTHLLQARRGAGAVLWGGQNTPGWELKITYTRVITTIAIVISAGLGPRVRLVPRQRGREGGAAAPRWRGHRPGPPPGRPARPPSRQQPRPQRWRRGVGSVPPSSTATWRRWAPSAAACWTAGPTTCTWM